MEGTADASANPPHELGLDPIGLPAAGNLDGTTGVLRQYGPAGDDDGHFVAFDVASANADVVRFLGMAAAGEAPQVGQ